MHKLLFAFFLLVTIADGAVSSKKFRFRIETKNKAIIWTMMEGRDLDHAKYKLNKRYPNCKIMSASEKGT